MELPGDRMDSGTAKSKSPSCMARAIGSGCSCVLGAVCFYFLDFTSLDASWLDGLYAGAAGSVVGQLLGVCLGKRLHKAEDSSDAPLVVGHILGMGLMFTFWWFSPNELATIISTVSRVLIGGFLGLLIHHVLTPYRGSLSCES
jgi:hypothetical protein